MKLFYKYILKYLIKNLLIVQLGVVTLSLITSTMGELKNLVGSEYTIIEFIQLQLCWMVINNNISMPITTTIASVMTIVQLMRTNEMLAYVSFGGRVSAISIPLMCVGMVVVLFMVFIEYIGVPQARTFRSDLIDDIKNYSRPISKKYSNIWMMDSGKRLVHIELMDVLNSSIQGVKLYNIDESGDIESYISVNSIIKEKDDFVSKGTMFVDLTKTPPKVTNNGEYQLPTKLFRELLEVNTDFPASLTPTQIYNIIKIVKDRGMNANGYTMILYSKIANILSVIILMILTFPIVVNFSRNYSITKNVAMAFAVGMLFWIVQAAMLSFGHSGAVSPFIANFFPIILFFIISVLIITERKTTS